MEGRDTHGWYSLLLVVSAKDVFFPFQPLLPSIWRGCGGWGVGAEAGKERCRFLNRQLLHARQMSSFLLFGTTKR